MSDRESARRSTDPFSVFLNEAAASAGKTAEPGLPPAGAALAITVQRLLAQRNGPAARAASSKEVDANSVAVLLYLADGEEHRTDDVGARLDMSDRRVGIAVDILAENGLVVIVDNETVKLTAAGRSLIVEISEIAARR